MRSRGRWLGLAVLMTLVAALNVGGTAAGDAGDVTVDKTAVKVSGCRTYEVELTITGEAAPGCADVMLVIDRSGSMDDGGGSCTDSRAWCNESASNCGRCGGSWRVEPFGSVTAAASGFVDQMSTDCPDRAGVVSYATTAIANRALTTNLTAVKSTISGLDVDTSGYTNIAQGIYQAKAELDANGRPGVSKAIIVLSDGVANRSQVSCTGCGTYPCSDTCCTDDAVAQAQAAKDAGYVVFSIFLNNVNQADSGCSLSAVEQLGEDTMRAIASGGNALYSTPDSSDLEDIYNSIAGQILPAARAAVVVDLVGSAFSIVPGSMDPAGTIDGDEITWDLGVIGSETVSLTYQVEANADQSGMLPANQAAQLDYVDYQDIAQTLYFPEPSVLVPVCVAADAGQNLGFGDEAVSVTIGGSPTASGGIPEYIYEWEVLSGDADSLSCTDCANPEASPGVTSEYQVRVTDTEGCMAVDTVNVLYLGPTAVELEYFEARATAGGFVVEWRTVAEYDNLGFNLYRAPSGERARIRLNDELIHAQSMGSPVGTSYRFVDDDVEAAGNYYYWLEEVDSRGLSTLHGPILGEGPSSSSYRVFLPSVVLDQ